MARSSRVPTSLPPTPRVDLITADVSARAALASSLEAEGLLVVEHFPGVEVDFASPGDGDPECIVIVHDPKRLDALVLIARLRAQDLKAPILILIPNVDETLRRVAGGHGVEIMVDGVARPWAVAAVVRNIVERHERDGPL